VRVLILAGGLGTRLAGVSQGLPKPMIPVAGRPFLTYILDRLPGDAHVTLCVGFKSEQIVDYFGRDYDGRSIDYSIEYRPLGTGGAILRAMQNVPDRDVCVINGDTVFDVPYDELMRRHVEYRADVTLALKPMQEFDRYGTVSVDGNNRILSFTEKKYMDNGLINGGVYMLNVQSIIALKFPEVFSLEMDLLEKNVQMLNMLGFSNDSLFIDIGVPEDLVIANRLLV